MKEASSLATISSKVPASSVSSSRGPVRATRSCSRSWEIRRAGFEAGGGEFVGQRVQETFQGVDDLQVGERLAGPAAAAFGRNAEALPARELLAALIGDHP
ncbi:hypothetical protein [Acrocarpospora sp. B8E8]|uniref:hypothetical protein n=1 Tax=Acrocarpospora sp. B8E8 TaxID=3153572 RepID=UPI00325EAAFD